MTEKEQKLIDLIHGDDEMIDDCFKTAVVLKEAYELRKTFPIKAELQVNIVRI
jgi:hypothetical protein